MEEGGFGVGVLGGIDTRDRVWRWAWMWTCEGGGMIPMYHIW